MEDKKTNDKKINMPDTAYAVMVSLFGAVGVTGTIAVSYELSYTNSFLAFIFFVVSILAIKDVCKDFRNSNTRAKIFAYILSLLISALLHMGAQLECYENVNFKQITLYVFTVLLAVYLAPIIHHIWIKVPAMTDRLFVKKNDEETIKYTWVWLIIFILWLPTFFALFPGAFVYDATEEYTEVISRSFSMHHPLFHVLMLGGIVHLAEYLGLGANAGIVVYTLFQMIAFSAVLAYLIHWLGMRGMNKKYQLISILFFGLFPIFPMYAVCSAKDTLFSAAFLMVIILLVEYSLSTKTFFDKKMLLFVASSVIMMLLRNNGIYAYAVAIPVIALIGILGKNDKKQLSKLIILMLLSFVLFAGINKCLKIMTHATDDEYQEKLTVPIQQLARAYKYSPETFSEDEKSTLYEILPEDYLKTYNPRISDILKSGFDNRAYSRNPHKYQKLWLDIGLKKPNIYLNAWLANCYGYWYPDMIINVYGGNQMYTFKYKDSSYFGFETEPPGERHSLFPLLERFYRNVSLELFQQKIPVLSMLFAPGFVFYLFAWSLFGLMRDKRWMIVAAFMPMILLWATVLLGPTVLVRYVLVSWCAIPMFFAVENIKTNE